MESRNVKELVVYTIKPDFQSRIEEVQAIVKRCVEGFPGFKSIESFQSTSDSSVLMDWLEWDSLENAKKAQSEFEKHPEYSKLMDALDQMKFADHFTN
ncbi:MAG: hypothetical protein JXQ90_21850 [Cyclobacteriaceae bacterium]